MLAYTHFLIMLDRDILNICCVIYFYCLVFICLLLTFLLLIAPLNTCVGLCWKGTNSCCGWQYFLDGRRIVLLAWQNGSERSKEPFGWIGIGAVLEFFLRRICMGLMCAMNSVGPLLGDIVEDGFWVCKWRKKLERWLCDGGVSGRYICENKSSLSPSFCLRLDFPGLIFVHTYFRYLLVKDV
ncbi:hypothetical protein BGZ60DRAFT_147056 [Tricladium varicosporioides]|nr:hypothetical protein BGZ60DRAFT_147056 [Hymenoscyphus varicosporioides]